MDCRRIVASPSLIWETSTQRTAMVRAVLNESGFDFPMFARAHSFACMRDDIMPVASHKSSILQDYERGRSVEIDVLLTAPLTFADPASIALPTFRSIAALALTKAEEARADLIRLTTFRHLFGDENGI